MQNRTICKYNLRGQCRFGERCRNIHEDPKEMVGCFLGMDFILVSNICEIGTSFCNVILNIDFHNMFATIYNI